MKLVFYRAYIIPIFLLSLFIFTSCKQLPQSSNKPTMLSECGNMYNYNLVTKNEYGIFYLIKGDGKTTLLRANDDWSNAVSIGEGIYSYFLIDDSIYFTKDSETGIYKMDYRGGKVEKICDLPCDELISSGNRIYFSTYDKDKNCFLYSMSRDGKDLKQLFSGDAYNLQPIDNYLYYYLNVAVDDSEIYRLELDTLKSERVGTAHEVDRFFVNNGTVYYHDLNDLYSLNLNSGTVNQITKKLRVFAESMNVYGNYLIYSKLDDNGTYTYALNMTTGESIKISDYAYDYVLVIGDELMTNKGKFVPAV